MNHLRSYSMFESVDTKDMKEDILDYFLGISEQYGLEVKIDECVIRNGKYINKDMETIHRTKGNSIGLYIEIKKSGLSIDNDDLIKLTDDYKTAISRLKRDFIIELRMFAITSKSISICLAVSPINAVEVEEENTIRKLWRSISKPKSFQPYSPDIYSMTDSSNIVTSKYGFIVLFEFGDPDRSSVGHKVTDMMWYKNILKNPNLEINFLSLDDLLKKISSFDISNIDNELNSRYFGEPSKKIYTERYKGYRLFIKRNRDLSIPKITDNTPMFILITEKKNVPLMIESKMNNKPNFKKYLIDDFVVYQGRDAESNDYVTLDLANEDDLWFHTKGVPGSHVVIKVKDKLPTETIIKKVAEITAKNSKAKEGNVTIVYCKKKYVTKDKGMKAGQVKVDSINSNEIIITKK